MTDHAKRIWLHAIAIVAKARNKCAPGERFEALNLVMGDLEDARRRDQLIMPDFPAVCPDCGQHCETHNGESDCAALQSGEAQAAPEPIIMVDGDKVFGPGKAPDSYVRYMIDDSRFPAWHGCMTHYDRADASARAGMGAVKPLVWTEYETDGWADRADAEATPPAAQVTVADAIAALKAMPTRTEALGGQDFKYIQLGEALDTLRALAGDGRRRQMKALIVGGPNRGQVVDMSNVVHTDSRYFGCKFGDKEFHFIVGADVPNPHEYVMRELCRAYEYLMKGETHRQHIKKNGKL